VHLNLLEESTKMKIVNRFTSELLLEIKDLRSASLSGADLSGADLRSANLRSADLRSANLRSADLSGADLSGASLRSADLIVGGQRSDGYRFLAYRIGVVVMIRAGCRYASIEASRAYWGDPKYHGGEKCAAESLALVNSLEALAKIAGWL
jgi:hypothetical protein